MNLNWLVAAWHTPRDGERIWAWMHNRSVYDVHFSEGKDGEHHAVWFQIGRAEMLMRYAIEWSEVNVWTPAPDQGESDAR